MINQNIRKHDSLLCKYSLYNNINVFDKGKYYTVYDIEISDDDSLGYEDFIYYVKANNLNIYSFKYEEEFKKIFLLPTGIRKIKLEKLKKIFNKNS